jgi:4a-hydroxytetrahydrobiopterin dehydratase
MDLVEKKCQACDAKTPKLNREQIDALRREVPEWQVQGERLHRHYQFKDFRTSIRFVDELAKVAEAEGHHPVFSVNLNQVDVDNWTHSIGGLSENDFILAAKLDRAARS